MNNTKTIFNFDDESNASKKDHYKAHSFPIDAIPAPKHGSRHSNWSKTTINDFLKSGDDCWEITEDNRGKLKTIRDADRVASNLGSYAKSHKLPVAACSRMGRAFLINKKAMQYGC